MQGSNELFVFKWKIFGCFCAVVGFTECRTQDRQLDIDEVKASIRTKVTRLDLSRGNNLQTCKIQFANLLKSGPDRQIVERICAELALSGSPS